MRVQLEIRALFHVILPIRRTGLLILGRALDYMDAMVIPAMPTSSSQPVLQVKYVLHLPHRLLDALCPCVSIPATRFSHVV